MRLPEAPGAKIPAGSYDVRTEGPWARTMEPGSRRNRHDEASL
jgi:hypothetical protein